MRASINDYNKEVLEVVNESVIKIHTHFDTINEKVKLIDEIKSNINLEF